MADIVFTGHIDRDAFETSLRVAFAKGDANSLDDAAACQARGSEVLIQLVLFMSDELNRGTPAPVLFDGGCRLIGNLIENFARQFTSEGGPPIIDDIFQRIIWQVGEDDNDSVITVLRPQTIGGRA